MLGALLKTVIEARARRLALIDQAATQRQRMGRYLDALDPAAVWLGRLVSGLRYILARPVIPAGIIAALLILKPRRAIAAAVWAWKGMSWLRRLRTALR